MFSVKLKQSLDRLSPLLRIHSFVNAHEEKIQSSFPVTQFQETTQSY